ncbi:MULTISPECIES: carboxymuconolactone decarboxylase family protein [unclassified Streptomyces]|uniref:carboxymuconolactone decarboxylase family protein n=1 Tax=unclassified Streptomyces TaxID=2593676 RepID=UPI002DD97E18|nr:carboxymuconolactone decarboxylase family protein [Streptomyces sp. NBC_01257]WRZ69506.1 carboxymuconolactone decarboxylase family protein [Streptomyces sp. NBC_01257]
MPPSATAPPHGAPVPPARPGPGGPRLVPLTPDEWPPSLRTVLDSSRKDGPGRNNLFGTLAHHLPLAEAWLALARVLTHDGTLGARDRELVVLRTAHLLGCDFVHARHIGQARLAGLDTAETTATALPLDAHPWAPDDLALLRTTDALAAHADVPDAVWQQLTERMRPDQLVELLVLAGQSAMMCMTLRTLRTPADAPSGQPEATGREVFEVRIERDLCCSSGQCVSTAPESFEQSDVDGLVTLRPDHLTRSRPADLQLAAELCPSGAITLTTVQQQ